jgi:hypothetical protein
MSIVPSKSCTRCSEMKPLTDYHKQTRAKDGHKSECKICKRTDNAKYRAENYEAVSAYEKNHLKSNREAILAYHKDYRNNNKEAVAAYGREYRAENKKAIRANERRRRARKIGNGFEVYTETQVFELYGTDCHICMEPVDLDAPRGAGIPGWERGLHMDHLIALVNGGPDNLDNIRPSHGLCNLKKSAS